MYQNPRQSKIPSLNLSYILPVSKPSTSPSPIRFAKRGDSRLVASIPRASAHVYCQGERAKTWQAGGEMRFWRLTAALPSRARLIRALALNTRPSPPRPGRAWPGLARPSTLPPTGAARKSWMLAPRASMTRGRAYSSSPGFGPAIHALLAYGPMRDKAWMLRTACEHDDGVVLCGRRPGHARFGGACLQARE